MEKFKVFYKLWLLFQTGRGMQKSLGSDVRFLKVLDAYEKSDWHNVARHLNVEPTDIERVSLFFDVLPAWNEIPVVIGMKKAKSVDYPQQIQEYYLERSAEIGRGIILIPSRNVFAGPFIELAGNWLAIKSTVSSSIEQAAEVMQAYRASRLLADFQTEGR